MYKRELKVGKPWFRENENASFQNSSSSKEKI